MMDISVTAAGMGHAALGSRLTVLREGQFAGKIILVSGDGSGIGRATAVLFTRLGATLVLCVDEESLTKTVAAEWAPLRIRVDWVAPGTIRTEGFGDNSGTARASLTRQVRCCVEVVLGTLAKPLPTLFRRGELHHGWNLEC
jgi:NAD(P)-dependent dehydrogenase (short-subunit alcohol dehydrogenase family)